MSLDVQRFLGNVSMLLAESLDHTTTLQRIARLCVPLLADQCIVDLIDDEGDAPVAIAHVNPEKERLLKSLVLSKRPAAGMPRHGVSAQRAIQPQLFPEVPDALLSAMARDPDHLASIHELAPKSVIVVPMVARGRTVGAIMLVLSESERRYDDGDLRTAQELAQRAAPAVDNARLYRDAREAIHLRDEVLAFVSHDLKAPLTSIRLHVEMLQDLELEGDDVQDRLRRLARVEALTTRMAHLIDDLMDTARMQLEQELVLDCSATDLIALAVHVVADHQALTDCHTLNIETDESELTGFWDAPRLSRVLDNLVGNAVKYSPEGGAIDVRIDRADDWAILTVRDEGVGIPPGEEQRVFRRFYRASNVAGRFAGAGIGLAGARQIVERHGGSIEVDSVEGQGTTFSVRLPLQAVGDEPIGDVPDVSVDGVAQSER